MGVKEWTIEKYVLANGKVPFDDWFEGFSYDFQARIDARLDRVSLGNFGTSRGVGQGVHELKFSFGPGYRIYFGTSENRIVLLLCGGDKSTQKKDIKYAQLLWKQYLTEKEA